MDKDEMGRGGVGKRRKRKLTRRKESENREEGRQTSPEEGDRRKEEVTELQITVLCNLLYRLSYI